MLYQTVRHYKRCSLKEKEGRKEMIYLTTHSTHFKMVIWCQTYGIGPLSKRGNMLLPHRLLFLINSKGSFICTIPQTG